MNRFAMSDNLIRAARKRHMTQRAIAERIGTHVNTIGRWMRGDTIPSAYDLYRMARILSTTMDELMKGVDDGKDV